MIEEHDITNSSKKLEGVKVLKEYKYYDKLHYENIVGNVVNYS